MIPKREGTTFIKTMPKGAGRVVAMVVFNNHVYIASQYAVFMLTEKNHLRRVKFEKTNQTKQEDR